MSSKSHGIWSLVFALFSYPLLFVRFSWGLTGSIYVMAFISGIFSITAIVFGSIGIKKGKNEKDIVLFVLSIIGIVLASPTLILVIYGLLTS